MRHVQWLGQPDEESRMVPVPEKQVRSQLFWETTAVVVTVPFMTYLATNRALPAPARVLAGLVGVATLVVDGALIHKNRKRLEES